jgi:hypothetical protein
MRRSPERSAHDPQFERALPQRGGVARPAHPQTQQPSVWRWKRHCESYGGAVDGFRVPDEPGAVIRVLAIEIVPCHGARHADLPRDGRPDCVNDADAAIVTFDAGDRVRGLVLVAGDEDGWVDVKESADDVGKGAVIGTLAAPSSPSRPRSSSRRRPVPESGRPRIDVRERGQRCHRGWGRQGAPARAARASSSSSRTAGSPRSTKRSHMHTPRPITTSNVRARTRWRRRWPAMSD